MTARPLPEAVEKALVAFSDAVSDMENGHATNDDAVRAEDALRAAIDAALAPGEPVAWGVFNGTSFKCAYDDERAAREDYPRYAVVPLYAAPPALPASVERRMAFMEVERRVEEAVKARDARIARLEAALRFYADAANYGQSHGADCGQVYTGDGNVEEYHGGDCGLPEVMRDDGAKARAALDEGTAKS